MLIKRLIYMTFVALTLLLVSACKDDPASADGDDDNTLASGMYCISEMLGYASGACGEGSAQTSFCIVGDDYGDWTATSEEACGNLTKYYCECTVCEVDGVAQPGITTEDDCEELGGSAYNSCHEWSETEEECDAVEGGEWTLATTEWTPFMDGWVFCANLMDDGTFGEMNGTDADGTWSVSGTTFNLQYNDECRYYDQYGDDSMVEGITTEEDCLALGASYEWMEGHSETGTLTTTGFSFELDAEYHCEFATDPTQEECVAAGGEWNYGDCELEDEEEEECLSFDGATWVMEDGCMVMSFTPYSE